MIAICTPCKGRLAHVKQTVPRFARQAAVVFVDYDCPERAGQWVERHIPHATVTYTGYRPRFNKSAAHNIGARAAIDVGAQVLCFADADTLINEGLVQWCLAKTRPGQFIMAGLEHRDLTGFLVAHVQDFLRVNGYDEAFEGWGSEDLDMRIRLRLQAGLDYIRVPPGFLTPITHDDTLRTRFYKNPNKDQTNHENMIRVIERIIEITGDTAAPYRLDVRQLLGDPRLHPHTYAAPFQFTG